MGLARGTTPVHSTRRRFHSPDAADKRSRTRGDTLLGSADAIEAAWSNF
jgi:hypothetical protein